DTELVMVDHDHVEPAALCIVDHCQIIAAAIDRDQKRDSLVDRTVDNILAQSVALLPARQLDVDRSVPGERASDCTGHDRGRGHTVAVIVAEYPYPLPPIVCPRNPIDDQIHPGEVGRRSNAHEIRAPTG